MIYKIGVRYVSKKKNISGLRISGVRNSGFAHDYSVIESSPDGDWNKSKIVHKGTLNSCRSYIKGRFYK